MEANINYFIRIGYLLKMNKLKTIEADYKEAIANSKVEISRSCFCKGMFNN